MLHILICYSYILYNIIDRGHLFFLIYYGTYHIVSRKDSYDSSSVPEPQSGAIDSRIFTRRRMLHVILPLFIVSIIAFLDRVNIAYAGLTMKENLSMVDTSRYLVWAPVIFFIGYVLFEVPASLIAARCNAMHWVARIMF